LQQKIKKARNGLIAGSCFFLFWGEYKAFALSGRIVHRWFTQGVALG
jgi:hypothetical protein